MVLFLLCRAASFPKGFLFLSFLNLPMVMEIPSIGAIFFATGFLVSLAGISPNFLMLIIGCAIMVAGLFVMQNKWGE